MNNINLIEKSHEFLLTQAINYISGDPENNLPKLLNIIDNVGWGPDFEVHKKVIHEIMDDPQNIWYQYIMDLWRDIDVEVLKTTFCNFGLNASLIGTQKQEALRGKRGYNIPWAILLDPTSACNLHCTGCWAAEYGNKLNLSYETLDSVVRQGKELSTYFYIFSGGEPLIRKADILRLCEAHPDCQFSAFTNGTLIDEAFANEMLRVKNFIPSISVEGFEEDTDFRRGDGTFQKVEKAMSLLRMKRLPFGVSCCYTKKNVDMIGSESYFNQMIKWGAKFCWFFTYIPVGKEAVPDLMVTTEQRAFMYHQIRKFRETKPIFVMDFWNDGEFVKGCIAGGRRYLHINAGGDIEPCAFIHYSDSNIHEKSLVEALQSPLFMAYKDGQPFNDNHLRPCPLLDNPDELIRIIDTSGAHSTDLMAPENVHDLSEKCRNSAENWASVADELWQCSGHCGVCHEKVSIPR